MARAEAPRTLQATVDSQPPDKQKRKSYTRETKLKVIEFGTQHGFLLLNMIGACAY